MTEPSHLHRLPFSVNEKTSRIAVPFALAPPFAGLPHALEDMPRVDDPDLRDKLEAPLKVLAAALETTGLAWAVVGDVPPVPNAPWSLRRSKKRKGPPDAAATAKDLPVAPLRIDAAATVAWLGALRAATAADDDATVAAIADERARSVAERSQREGKNWRARLRHEADLVAKLVAALTLKDAPASGGAHALLHGETYTRGGDGRTLTHYPQLDEAQFVARFATRCARM